MEIMKSTYGKFVVTKMLDYGYVLPDARLDSVSRNVTS